MCTNAPSLSFPQVARNDALILTTPALRAPRPFRVALASQPTSYDPEQGPTWPKTVQHRCQADRTLEKQRTNRQRARFTPCSLPLSRYPPELVRVFSASPQLFPKRAQRFHPQLHSHTDLPFPLSLPIRRNKCFFFFFRGALRNILKLEHL